MKKWLTALFILFTIGLAACGEETSEPVDATEEETEEEVDELTAEEVYEQAMATTNELESVELAMDVTQSIEIPDEEVTMDTQTVTEAELTIDPLAMYQTGTVTMKANDQTQESKTELYMVEDEIYVYDSASQAWMKMDSSMIPMDQISNQQQDPSEQLKAMEQFVDVMELEENDGQYILKITGDGEELQSFTEEIMSEYMDPEMLGALGEEGSNIMENMSINDVYYEVFVDSETFKMNAFNMDMDMTFDVEGQQLNLSQTAEAEYTGINTIDSIEVPQEVKDEAIDLMDELEGMEETEGME